jgi:hypothetical protein
MSNSSHNRALRWLALSVLLVGLPVMVGATPAIAYAPQPVVAVQRQDLGEQAEPVEEMPAVWEAPPHICRSHQADTTGAVQASYPGPVVAVGTPRSRPANDEPPPVVDCTTVIRVKLIVESPAGQRPIGIGADVAGASVPHVALEGGFEIDLPPNRHDVTLSQLPPDWELVATECGCTEAVRTARLRPGSVATADVVPMLTSFPGPVVAIGPAPTTNSLTCGDASAPAGGSSSAVSRTARVATFGPSGGTSQTLAPQPVVALENRPRPWRAPDNDDPSPASISWTGDGNIRISDSEAAGGVFRCDWTVRWAFGDVIIETVTDPPGEEGRFGYRATPGFLAPPASPTALAGASPPGAQAEIRRGSWSVALTGLGNGWSVTQSSCTEAIDKTVSSASGATATIGMDAGDAVRCRFELGRRLVTLREGRWRADNRPTRFRCDTGLDLPVDGNVQFGRLTLSRGGDRLVGRGLSSGSGAARLARDPDDPQHYTGSVRIRAGGGTFRYTATLDVINAEKARAQLRATIRVQGRRCTINRTIRLSYAGG